MVYHPKYHGIRLDVLAEEEGRKRRFNIEMQVKSESNLPKRSRYYHSQLDMDVLLTGKRYNELPDTYVIFICDFALSPQCLYRYTYQNVCRENKIPLGDGRTTIFLSTKGKNDADVPKALSDFLKYVDNPVNPGKDIGSNDFVNALEKQIQAIKRDREWEAQYMQLEEMLMDEREEGRKETLARINLLITKLSEQNRMDELVNATANPTLLEELFKEFGI